MLIYVSVCLSVSLSVMYHDDSRISSFVVLLTIMALVTVRTVIIAYAIIAQCRVPALRFTDTIRTKSLLAVTVSRFAIHLHTFPFLIPTQERATRLACVFVTVILILSETVTTKTFNRVSSYAQYTR